MDIFGGGAESGTLQSGFVFAAILLAVFFAERLGGSGELAQRSYQVVLALALAFVVISGTVAFNRPPDLEFDPQVFLGDSFDSAESFEEASTVGQDSLRTAAENRTVQAGLGLMFVVAGLAALARLRVIPIGFVIGGLFLLLFGSPQQAAGSGDVLDSFSALFGAFLPGGGGVGQARDIAYFAVLLVGTGALVGFGLWRWDGRRTTETA